VISRSGGKSLLAQYFNTQQYVIVNFSLVDKQYFPFITTHDIMDGRDVANPDKMKG